MYLENQLLNKNISCHVAYCLFDKNGDEIDFKAGLAGSLDSSGRANYLELLYPSFCELGDRFSKTNELSLKGQIAFSSQKAIDFVDIYLTRLRNGNIELIAFKNEEVETQDGVSINNIPLPVSIINRSGKIINLNHQFLDFFTDKNALVLPLHIQDVVRTNHLSPESFDFEKMIGGDQGMQAVLCHFKGKSTSNHTFILNFSPICYNSESCFMVTVKDITPYIEIQENLEAQNEDLKRKVSLEYDKNKTYELELLQKSRLESLGEIASGIFHELNQPLSHISLKIDNLLDKWQNSDVTESYLGKKTEQIQRQVQRMRGIIDEMKQFSTTNSEKGQFINVKDIINLAVEDVSYLKVNGLVMRIHCPDEMIIKGNAIELEQVFVNLILNSIQSLKNKKQQFPDFIPEITIRGSEGDKMVNVTLNDNGSGLDEACVKEVFKAFYTTKQDQGGTGLGLFIVNNVMRKFKGTINISTKEGEFFKVLLSFPNIPKRN